MPRPREPGQDDPAGQPAKMRRKSFNRCNKSIMMDKAHDTCFECPITANSPPMDPVIALDGIVYERAALVDYLENAPKAKVYSPKGVLWPEPHQPFITNCELMGNIIESKLQIEARSEEHPCYLCGLQPVKVHIKYHQKRRELQVYQRLFETLDNTDFSNQNAKKELKFVMDKISELGTESVSSYEYKYLGKGKGAFSLDSRTKTPIMQARGIGRTLTKAVTPVTTAKGPKGRPAPVTARRTSGEDFPSSAMARGGSKDLYPEPDSSDDTEGSEEGSPKKTVTWAASVGNAARFLQRKGTIWGVANQAATQRSGSPEERASPRKRRTSGGPREKNMERSGSKNLERSGSKTLDRTSSKALDRSGSKQLDRTSSNGRPTTQQRRPSQPPRMMAKPQPPRSPSPAAASSSSSSSSVRKFRVKAEDLAAKPAAAPRLSMARQASMRRASADQDAGPMGGSAPPVARRTSAVMATAAGYIKDAAHKPPAPAPPPPPPAPMTRTTSVVGGKPGSRRNSQPIHNDVYLNKLKQAELNKQRGVGGLRQTPTGTPEASDVASRIQMRRIESAARLTVNDAIWDEE